MWTPFAQMEPFVLVENLLCGRFILAIFTRRYYSASMSQILQGPTHGSEYASASVHVTTHYEFYCAQDWPHHDPCLELNSNQCVKVCNYTEIDFCFHKVLLPSLWICLCPTQLPDKLNVWIPLSKCDEAGILPTSIVPLRLQSIGSQPLHQLS